MSETPGITAFLDASVLYPALLRDILMRMAAFEVFQARWSALAQDEWTSALTRNRADIPRERINRVRHLMDANPPEAMVDGFEHRIAALELPDPDDRHILATAIHCGAGLIVTANLRDFPPAALSAFGIEAVHPDSFIARLLNDRPESAVSALQRLRAAAERPPMSPSDLLAVMRRQGLPAAAAALETLLGRL